MKKLIALLIALFTLFLVSCGEEVVDTTATTATTATAESTTATDATEATTSSSSSEPKEKTIPVSEITSLPIIGNYTSTRDIEFKNFFRYPSSYIQGDRWYADNYIIQYDLVDLVTKGIVTITGEYYNKLPYTKGMSKQFYIFAIAGCQGNQLRVGIKSSPETDYYAYGYKYGEEFTDDTVYTLTNLPGVPQTLCYGYHRFDIGDKYMLVLAPSEDIERSYKHESTYYFKLHLKIEEIDGVEWVYADNYWTLEKMECAVKITDEYENLMYKPGKDDDVIAYMEANGIDIPTYDYKCELNAFIAELSSGK